MKSSIFLAFFQKIWYLYVDMKKRISYFISRKNLLAWLMALLLTASAVIRIIFFGEKGTEPASNVWSLCVLPVAASLLYVLITMFSGRDRFYQTAIPIWLLALYFFFRVRTYSFGTVIDLLYLTVLFCLAAAYQLITSGRIGGPMALIPIYLVVAVPLLYLSQDLLVSNGWKHFLLPDLMLMAGLFLTVFAIRFYPSDEYHPTWGDRPDGRRVRSLHPISQMIPYIMVNRNGASNKMAASIEITHAERYVRQKRREGLTSFGLMHVFLAAYCRAVAKYPAVNRFISGQKVYSRGEDIQFCIVVKKEMSIEAPETTIKVHFSPRDTAEDVYRKLSAEVEKVKSTPLDSSFDNLTHAFTLIPGVFLKFTVWLLKLLDYFGLLPKSFLELSPFHGSIFITSLGSLGIPPVYHHLYDFGNLPMFCAIGRKRKSFELQEDGTVVQKKYLDCKFTSDERITDGFYFAAFLKYYFRIMRHPEELDVPPEEIVSDIY